MDAGLQSVLQLGQRTWLPTEEVAPGGYSSEPLGLQWPKDGFLKWYQLGFLPLLGCPWYHGGCLGVYCVLLL